MLIIVLNANQYHPAACVNIEENGRGSRINVRLCLTAVANAPPSAPCGLVEPGSHPADYVNIEE